MTSPADPAVSAAAALAAERSDPAATMRKIAWRVMPLLMVCYMFAFYDRTNISFAKFQLQRDLHLSDTAYGLGATLFVVGYVVFEVPSNLLLYRVGARRWLARIMISWGIATAAMMFVQREWQFYALRFLIGAFEAGFFPGVYYYMTLWFPARHRGRVTSFLFAASACSQIIGGPISGLVLDRLDGASGLHGWNWLFLLGGLPCVLLGMLLLLRLDERVADARWLSPGEKQLVSGWISEQNRQIRGHSLIAALREPGFLLLGLIYFLIQIASYGLNFWAPQLIKSAGIQSTTIIGLLAAVPYIFGAITMLAVGRLSDGSGERRTFVAVLIAIASVGFLAAGQFASSTGLIVLALALIGTGVVAAVPAFWALPPKVVAGAGAAGGIALINTLGQVGGIVSPVMVGAIRDATGSTTPVMYVIACSSIVCAAILLFAAPEVLRRRDAPPTTAPR